MAGNFQEWLQQGEALYQAALKEYHSIEAQLEELESKRVAKQAEVNQIAQVIGRAPVEGNRPPGTQLVAADVIDFPSERQTGGGGGAGSSNASIARALTGKFGR